MADAVTSQTIIDGERVAVMKFTNASDGTGEAAVKKVDVSALATNRLGEACTSVQISKVHYATAGMGVNIFFDATANVLAMGLPADSEGSLDFSSFTGIPNNAGAGKTGDLLFSTVGHASGDTYMVVLELIKNY
jgi:hypothetical protein